MGTKIDQEPEKTEKVVKRRFFEIFRQVDNGIPRKCHQIRYGRITRANSIVGSGADKILLGILPDTGTEWPFVHLFRQLPAALFGSLCFGYVRTLNRLRGPPIMLIQCSSNKATRCVSWELIRMQHALAKWSLAEVPCGR